MPHKIAVIGLGYVGLPLAHAFSEKYELIVTGYFFYIDMTQFHHFFCTFEHSFTRKIGAM